MTTPTEERESGSHSRRPDDALLAVIIEDDPGQRRAMQLAFESRRIKTLIAGTCLEALRLLDVQEPQVITLDLGLPDYDGLDLCRRLRRTQRCPIIVVSGDGDEDVMIAALDSGADDYVVKPVSADLLMARVRVVLRHANALASALGQTTFTVGDLFLDVEAHLLTIAGHTVDVSPRQFRLLTALLRNEGRVLTHRQLSMAAGGDASDVANADGLRGALSHLRKRIGTGPQRPSIITEPHIGYRLLAPE